MYYVFIKGYEKCVKGQKLMDKENSDNNIYNMETSDYKESAGKDKVLRVLDIYKRLMDGEDINKS